MKQFVFNKKKTDLNDAEVNDDSTYVPFFFYFCSFYSLWVVAQQTIQTMTVCGAQFTKTENKII